jgi:hypothetical protein
MADAQDPDVTPSTAAPRPPFGGHGISFADAIWFDSARVNCERGELCGEEGARPRVASTEEATRRLARRRRD